MLEEPTAPYEGANPLCGDRITMMLGIRDGVVAEVGFTGRGCAISQASASLLTDEIKGKPVDEVAKLSTQDLLDLLGIEISPARLKCALLSLDTLEHALAESGVAPVSPSHDLRSSQHPQPAPAGNPLPELRTDHGQILHRHHARDPRLHPGDQSG